MIARALFLISLAFTQAIPDCKNCVTPSKGEKAMFLAHSDACQAQSGAPARLVAALLRGEGADSPALRRHVYCVLLRCKLVAKDGKLQKAAVLGRLAARDPHLNATKLVEACADQSGDSPEDLAWNLFRCGYDKKAVLFDYMPTVLE